MAKPAKARTIRSIFTMEIPLVPEKTEIEMGEY
jgi:hypothetical protein